jgi:group I intron endonuclease
VASGIYAIRNKTNGKVYIGSSVSISRRWAGHRCGLRRGHHHAPRLQRAWLKYGEAAFDLVVLEYCARECLQATEQAWIDALRAADPSHGYNQSREANTRLKLGHIVTPETRAKLAEFQRSRAGWKHSEEALAKISAASSQQMSTQDNRARVAILHLAHKADFRERISLNHPRRKLDEAQARSVKARLMEGESPAVIARDLKVSRALISHIKHGRNWQWLSP